ncbi:MAG: hypothetical protein CSA63_01915 [Propionibacterium sp.]|nr:MAG: hypothetical protein CSA63_01915 [Propionibacterium sp.]
MASLAWYHQQMYGFHTGDFIRSQTHAYEAHPAGWLLMVRPIGIDAVNDIKPGTGGCPGPDNCLQVISGLGTPLLWWAAALALLVGIVWWVTGRDSRYALPIVAGMSTYLTWFPSADRPLFFFYAITIIPFTTIILAMLLGQFLGPPDWPKRKRRAWMVGSYIALVAANFAFIYPILTDQILPRSHWLARMWLSTWI